MALYLVQHGKALSKTLDPEEDLSEDGIDEIRRITSVAEGYGIHVSKIRHSVKKRARHTAEIIASALNPENGIEETIGIKPMDDVIAFSTGLDPAADEMIVGHLPFLEKLTAYLVTGRVEPPIFKLQNGGILCLDKMPDTEGWIIKWGLMPDIG